MKKTKFIFVTGGIISGIGKGLIAASLGRLLIANGYSVAPIKIDPYLNEDAGTINPTEHGEVFVTDDGKETDLDLGHYERFMGISLNKKSNFTSGSVFRAVLDKERTGEYLGETIQFIPHITDEIQKRILDVAKKQDFVLVEIGGTMGADIEIQPFAEAIKQFKLRVGKENYCLIHVVKIDYIFPSDEEKTKPIQHSIKTMTGLGLFPDILIVRSKRKILKSNLDKISFFGNIPKKCIVEAVDTTNIYEIPVNLKKKGLLSAVYSLFNLKKKGAEKAMDLWKNRINKILNPKKEIKIAIIGKYHKQSDAYISINEALRHSSALYETSLKLIPINSEKMKPEKLEEIDGIVIPGGYGKRGTEGMIEAIKIAKKKNIPFLGLCLGLQMAVIEHARNELNWKDANSTELDPKTTYPVIDILEKQKNIRAKGGTQRVGSYPAILKKDSLIWNIYKKEHLGKGVINERHRHRFEVNPFFHKELENSGLILSGFSPDKKLVEFIELSTKKHPFFIATQAHPEFKSQFLKPHPLFSSFINAILKKQKN